MDATSPYRPATASAVPEAGLFGWLRYYGAAIVLSCIVGASCFSYAATLLHPGIEAWTMVADTRADLPTRQLGVVAQTLFNSRLPDTDRAELQLRAVPDARLLFLVAAEEDAEAAVSASRAAADSMIDAFEQAGYPGFEIVGTKEPGPIPRRSTSAVFAGLGTAFGLGTATAATLVSYRRRRPVLTVERAQELLRPVAVHVVRGRWRWLGGLRALPPVPSQRAQRRLREQQLSGPAVLPGTRRGWATSIERRLHLAPSSDEHGAALVVCTAGTPERELPVSLRGTRVMWIT